MPGLVIFRADASIHIGTGHVMRCLTLAESLKAQGVTSHFICREHPGHLIDFIRGKGHVTHPLPLSPRVNSQPESPALAHAEWLGATQIEDAELCAKILQPLHPDWLVVDHYALDSRWESALKPHADQLMVIDDLADRAHDCDLLLDQTFGRDTADYKPRVPTQCDLLCGAQFSLLRPEFAVARAESLRGRTGRHLKHLLISMGGVDKDNVTTKVLNALQSIPPPPDGKVQVVMGSTAPWLAEVKKQALNMRWPTEVIVNTDNMARLMTDCDLAIGAAGATSWERCCLGLPCIMLVLAENQQTIARGLAAAGAVRVLDKGGSIEEQLPRLLQELMDCPERLAAMSQRAADIVDGSGSLEVIRHMGALM